jgi:hypothetical protein
VLSLVLTVVALGGVDELLRRHYAASFGLNRWGYRGPVVGRKQPGERRVVVVGGSTTFGFGVSTEESLPEHLDRRFEALRSPDRWVNVVNLGYPSEGAWSLHFTLDDYAYLDYDVAILYAGYNDLRRPNMRAFRHDSPVFRATGYLPILPLVLGEKARAIRYGGDLVERFGREDPLFSPGLVDQATSGALKAAGEIARGLEHVLGPFSRDRTATHIVLPAGGGCAEPWGHYCEGMRLAVEVARGRGARVLVVSQPYISDTHVRQQANLAAMLRDRYGRDPRVAYLDLGPAIDLRDRTIAWDGMHLTPSGNAVIAERLVDPVLRLLDGASR